MLKSFLISCAGMFLLASCSPKEEVKHGVPRSTVKGLTVDMACLMATKGKNLTVPQFAQESLSIMKKYGIDPSDQKKVENVKLAIEEYKTDTKFNEEIREEIMEKCLKS
ncbi:MAG: hypothetical protein SFU25_06370 [Candidatus Caenarcaniphilales bacterium]|nr:hypothetical protein [Candidatus Caenarcaniphilales bacterium]